LLGFGGASCNPLTGRAGTGTCEYFNPFINSAFANSVSTGANTESVINSFVQELKDEFQTRLQVFDAVITGDVFELPAGPVSIASGVQYRGEKWDVDFDANAELGNVANGTISMDVGAKSATRSLFTEVAVPLMNDDRWGKLSLNAAGRYEKTGDIDTTDPKIGLLYKTPAGLLEVRGSWGTSFLAPTLFQRYTQSGGIAGISSTNGGTQPRTNAPRVATSTSGTPTLEPQDATTYSFGAVVQPFENFSVSVDYWHYRFNDLITTESAQAVVNQDDESLAAGLGPTGRVVRDGAGNPLQLFLKYFNAASLETSGIDFVSSYSHGFNKFGELRLDLNATYTGQYEYQASPTTPLFNGVNSWNTLNSSINPSIKWRGNLRAGWVVGGNRFAATLRYTGAFRNDQPAPGHPEDVMFDDYFPVDLSYGYTFEGGPVGISEIDVSVGLNNAFNTMPPTPVLGPAGTGPASMFGIHDYRARLAWAQLAVRF